MKKVGRERDEEKGEYKGKLGKVRERERDRVVSS
jgi:hypothetical protein